MKAKISHKIPKLKEAVATYCEGLLHEKYLSIDSPLMETLQEMEALDAQSQQLVQKAKDINEFQKTLDLDVTGFEYVEDARSELLYRLKMWRALHEWGGVLVEKWKTAPFQDVDVSEISASAEAFTKIAL
jgi:hypothetical protein